MCTCSMHVYESGASGMTVAYVQASRGWMCTYPEVRVCIMYS